MEAYVDILVNMHKRGTLIENPIAIGTLKGFAMENTTKKPINFRIKHELRSKSYA